MFKNGPLVSVIVPVYNVELYISECVNSLINQTYKNIEIILINDGSTDSSGKICADYKKIDSRIVVINKDNGGLADARNSGIKRATGEYLLFVDSDDYIDINCIDECINNSISNNLDITCFYGEKFYKNGKKEECFKTIFNGKIVDGRDVVFEMLTDNIGSQVVIGLYKKQCFDNIFFPLQRLYEDIPTTYKVFNNASKVGFIDKKFYFYRMNEESISHISNPLTPFHIYLGFLDHYLFSLEKNLNTTEKCLMLTAYFGLSTILSYKLYKYEVLQDPCYECENFLIQNRRALLKDKSIKRTRRFLMKWFLVSPKTFDFTIKLVSPFYRRRLK